MKTWEIWKAYDEGKTIQYKLRSAPCAEWVDVLHLGSYTQDIFLNPENYRIKPEPKKIWAVVCNETGGIVHSSNDMNKTRAYYNKYWCNNSYIYTYSLEEYIQV